MTGRILRVNLSSLKIKKESSARELSRLFLGGKGLGLKLLYDETELGIDALGPENKLIFANGPMTGLPPVFPRFAAVFKSPLTGIVGCCTAGGFFGPQLRFAGYDALIIEGRAPSPVCLLIEDEDVRIEPARNLWGKPTHEAIEQLRRDSGIPQLEVASIGIAGENLVKYACVTTGISRNLGRGGPGAVMGSKNLKAVGVYGTGALELVDPDGFQIALKDTLDFMEKDSRTVFYRQNGSVGAFENVNMLGELPTRNWSTGMFEGTDRIGGEVLRERYWKKNVSCSLCPIACGHLAKVESGSMKGTMVEGPEYETNWALGSNCGIDNPEYILRANQLCDEFGLDTISLGVTVGFMMECYERGLIDKDATHDIDLRFGSGEALLGMIGRIARREGIGNLAAEGSRSVAQAIGKGTERIAPHVKGMEMAWGDPRGGMGWALSLAVADRGGDHLNAQFYRIEFFVGSWKGKPIDKLSTDGKAAMVVERENFLEVVDCLLGCKFAGTSFDYERYLQLMKPALGCDLTACELSLIGERVKTLARMYNLREGLTRSDDTLAKRFMTEPLPDGPAKGSFVRKEDLDRMLDEYYAIRGWTLDGVPTKEKVKELGL